MLLSLRQCSAWLFRQCRLALPSWRQMCILLALIGIGCTICSLLGPMRVKKEQFRIQKRSVRPAEKRRVHIAARDVLNFPSDYHAKGVLSLPYGNIVEPFEAWYSAQHKMSRIDYYGGMDQTYQKELMGEHGFACKVVPEYSEQKQKTYRGCLHRRGTKRFPVKAQSIVPGSHYFKYVGDIMLKGHKAAKWQHEFKIYHKVNTYILFTTKTKPVKPLRYEMMGYDTLLSSYYDHYVLDYEMFEPWKFNYTTLQIPTDLDCFDFTGKKFSNTVGELNPMLEYMPQADSGAPYTLSHLPSDNGYRPQEKEPWGENEENFWGGNEQTNSYYPYHNSDGTNREESRTFTASDESSDNSRPLFSNEDKMTQNNNRFSSNYENLYGQAGSSQMFSWHGIAGRQSVTDEFEKGYPSAKPQFLHTSSTKFNDDRIPSSENLKYKSVPKRKNDSDKMNRLLKHRLSVKYKSHRKFSKQLKKSKTKSRKTSEFVYKGSHRKQSRIRRIFKFRNARRKKYSREKTMQKAFSDEKKSFDINERLRRNYEEIVNLLFDAFKIVHGKTYSSHHEHETRKDIYRHNLRFIQSRNRMHLGYKLRSNHLMDMTDEELNKHKGLLKDEDENSSNGGIPFKAMSDYFPTQMDWRSEGAVNSVKSQGICGSCYAYAVTGALEGAYFLKTGYLPDFSEQEIIDCSWGFGNRGCRGGYPHRAMQWILKHGGLAKEGNYGKYLAQEGYCHFKNVSIGVRVDSYMNISKGNATELKQAIAQYGPVSVLINTQPKSFKFYSSGVYYDPECSGNNLDHAALAVGYGVERGVSYWLIKNSWSKAWGDSGYIKIAQRNNNCGVTSKAVAVRIK